MRKLFLILLAASLITSCDSNVLSKKDDKKEKRDKDKDITADEDDINDDKNTGSNDDKSSWTSKDRKKWLNDCVEASGNAPQARTICSCVLEKIEKKYPDPSDAENTSEAEATRLAKQCMAENGGNTGGNEDEDDNDGGYVRNDEEDNSDGGGTWTPQQRRQFIQGCATTAQQAQGFTSQQATQYCDCMTRKVEKKYSFQQAARLTASDFQTQEWTDAALNCRSRLDY